MRNSKHAVAMFCAAGIGILPSAGSAQQEMKEQGFNAKNSTPVQADAIKEESGLKLPAFEVAVDFCSREITYGIPDNSDPILTYSGTVDWYGLGAEVNVINDLTRWGEKEGGYGNRRFKYQEINFGPGYTYTLDDSLIPSFPTPLELGLKYIYEWHPPVNHVYRVDGEDGNPDTQFIYFDVALKDLWLKPAIEFEWDIDRDRNALYVNPSIGHDWLLFGSDDSPTLEFGAQLGVGFGNARRNEIDADHAESGFKDVNGQLSFAWHLTDWATLSPYFQVSDELTPWMREAAEAADSHGDHLYFIGGCTLAFHF